MHLTKISNQELFICPYKKIKMIIKKNQLNTIELQPRAGLVTVIEATLCFINFQLNQLNDRRSKVKLH